MTTPAMKSKRPYVIPALYEWIVDSGCTCHLLVDVNYLGVDVPAGMDHQGRLVLDITPVAIRDLDFGQYAIAFLAQFERVTHQLTIPYGAVSALMAVESGVHISFEDDDDPGSPPNNQGHLKIVK